jgi:hypothetical protein
MFTAVFIKAIASVAVVFSAWLLTKSANFITKGWIGRQNTFIQVILYILMLPICLILIGLVGNIYKFFTN